MAAFSPGPPHGVTTSSQSSAGDTVSAMTRAQELLEQVRALPPEEREEFELLFAFEAEGSPNFSAEWDDEIVRRVEAWRAGDAGSVSWDSIQRTLNAKLDAS